MKHISIDSFKEVLDSEAHNDTVDFINVCTPAEYNERHIQGVRNIPLDSIGTHVAALNKKQTVYIHCRSGNRSRQAIETLQGLGATPELINVEGGLMAWQEAGYTTGSHTNRLPLMRQVFIGAGLLVLVGLVPGYFINDTFLFIPLFVSLGLLVSGITGWCGMALLLGKMPWNK
jgi:rhodanese-related sulfurtransferase